jgi:hypothetical protein
VFDPLSLPVPRSLIAFQALLFGLILGTIRMSHATADELFQTVRHLRRKLFMSSRPSF